MRHLAPFAAAILLTSCGTVIPYETDACDIHGRMVFIAHIDSMNPNVDREAALNKAQKRCRVLGFDKAEAFVGIRRKCTNSAIYDGIGGCTDWELERVYQCTNEPGTP